MGLDDPLVFGNQAHAVKIRKGLIISVPYAFRKHGNA
jgi:hypothetical protein